MNREVISDLEMLERLAAPAGKDVVDIGCGGGSLVRELTRRGARMVGVEVSQRQLATAVASDRNSGARYLVGQAQRLPLDDASADLALFMRTLHHVPGPDLLPALREARRVIRNDGLVYVAEPLAEGDFFSLVSLVEDEVDARRAAQEALDRASRAGLEQTTTVEYGVRVCIRDLAMLRARVVSVDPERAAMFDARKAEIDVALQSLGEAGEGPGERCFVQPMRVDVLRRVDASA